MSNRISSAGIVALVAAASLVGAGVFWATGVTALVGAQSLATSLVAPFSEEDPGEGEGAEAPDETFDSPPLAYEIGDCFMEPTADYGHVQFRDCSEPHDFEAYSDYEVPDTVDGSYPGDERMSLVADEHCHEAFGDFVGLPWEESLYDYAFVAPTEQTWTDFDDRLVQCLALDPEGEHSGSLEGVGE